MDEPVRGSWRRSRFAAVDVETTGLDPRQDRVLSVGVVPVDLGRIPAGRTTYVQVRHTADLRASNVLVHGLTPSVVARGLHGEDAAAAVARALAGRTPVAHCADVERAFLGPFLARAGHRRPRRYLDTDLLVRLLAGLEDGRWDRSPVPLGAAAARFGLPVHRPHHALGDALTTAQVFLAVASALEGHGIRTVRGLRRRSGLVRLTAFGPAAVRPFP